jgi:hypothetical protein
MSGTATNVVQASRVDNIVINAIHDRLGLFALAVVALGLVVAVVLSAVSGIEPETRADQPAGPQIAAVARFGATCLSGWVAPDKGPAPVPYTDDRPFVDAVLGSDGEITVTVQGLTGKSVVLQSMTVDIVRRSPPMTGIYLPRTCDGEITPRKYQVDLDAAQPRITPEPGTVPFPYKVNDFEPEQFVLTPTVTSADVELRLVVTWTAGSESGKLIIDDAGKPFRVTTPSAAREFCVHSDLRTLSWRPSC